MTSFLHDATSIVDLVRPRAATLGDRPAVTFVRDVDREGAAGSVHLSHAQLDVEARRIGAWLQDKLPAGSRVLLLYPGGLEFAAAFLGCVYAAMIAVPAPLPGQHQHQQRRVKRIAEDAAVGAILTDIADLAAVSDWATANGLGPLPCAATDDAGLGNADAWCAPKVNRQSIALLQYTSGSTGDPKGVMVSHHNLFANVSTLCRIFTLDERTTFGGWIPLYHDMGLIGHLIPSILLGSRCVLMSSRLFLMRPHRWLRMIDQHDIQLSAAPNFAYDLCARSVTDEQLAQLDLSRWTTAVSGSESITVSAVNRFIDRFAAAGFSSAAFSPAYGLAEATLVVSGSARRPPIIRCAEPAALEAGVYVPAGNEAPGRGLVSCGVFPELDLRVVNPETREVLPEGRVGELWLRGGSVTSGYWERPLETQESFACCTADGEGQYLRTGDLGMLIDGEVYITGRMKEMLIIHGRNLFPQDIEHEIRAQHPEIADRFGAVFGVPRSSEEETVVIVHEIKGHLGRLAEIAAAIKRTVAQEFGIAVGGVLLLRPGSVLRTTSGKIQRAAMRQLFLEGRLEALNEDLAPSLRQAMSAGAPRARVAASQAEELSP